MVKQSSKLKNLPVIFALLISLAVMIFPFLWAVSVSLQGPGEAFADTPHFFSPPYRFSNYAVVFQGVEFLRYAMNSLLITVICIIGQVFSNAFIAFGFARYHFKGSKLLFFLVLCTMMIPGNILTIPMYSMWQQLGALDTYIPLTVNQFFGTAFNIFLMRQCYLGIPNSLYEAAMIDGATPPYIFARVYLPLAKASLATIALTTFINSWNNMFDPLIYLTTKSKYTISLGLLYIKGKYEYNLELLMASSILAMLPVIVVYFFTQKSFVSGIAAGAVKG